MSKELITPYFGAKRTRSSIITRTTLDKLNCDAELFEMNRKSGSKNDLHATHKNSWEVS